MPKFTKKYMVENYERLYRHADLLELYLFDTQFGVKPDAVASEKTKDGDRVTMSLYRANGAMGGYVVIKESICSIWTLDDANRLYEGKHSEYSLAARCCLERLTIARQKIVNAAV